MKMRLKRRKIKVILTFKNESADKKRIAKIS